MDLRNGSITLRELMAQPRAKALLLREFPQFASGPMLMLGQRMKLNDIMKHCHGRVSDEQLKRVLRELSEI